MQQEITVFSEQLAALKREFYVPDVMTEQSSFIFLLESPHIQELKHGAPVSGASGTAMTKHLFGADYAKLPLGRLVKHNLDNGVHRPRLDAIGLMNVCNVPMQGIAYGDSPLRKEHDFAITAMQYIRSNNQRDSFSHPAHNAGQRVILDDLRRRLSTLTDASVTFVPCGRFAQKFFRLASLNSPQWTVIQDVPHPSYNSWDRPRYAPSINQLKNIFAQL